MCCYCWASTLPPTAIALWRTFFQGLCVRGCPSAMCQRSSFSKCAMLLCLNTLTCTQARSAVAGAE
jgi:hypothetical protein